jgi:hypothetical protein
MSIDFKQVAMQAILADGTIDENEIKILRKAIAGAGQAGIDFLIELRSAYARRAKGTPLSEAFEDFFYKQVQGHVVQEGKLSSKGVGTLRDKVFPGGKVDDRGYRFLSDLNKKTKDKAAEFKTFLDDVDKKRAKAAGKK